MKKKFKLFASIASVVLVFALMTIGVIAATSRAVNVMTTVGFTATGVSGTVAGTLTGTDNKTYYYNTTSGANGSAYEFTPSSSALVDWTLGNETPLAINNNNGEAESVVYTFEISNTSTTNAMAIKISSLSVGDNLMVTQVKQDSASVEPSQANDYNLSNVEASGSSTVVITVDVRDNGASVTSQAVSFEISLSSVNA